MKYKIFLNPPTNDIVNHYLERFKEYDRYSIADQAIIQLFEKFPYNKKIEDILLKISVINDLYSTNIFGTFILSKHIQNLNIDSDLLAANPSVVNKIATGHGISKPRGGDRSFYSFATKYCSWHNKDAFPIYDSFVHKIIVTYRNELNFPTFTESDLKDYTKFKEIIINFRDHYSLTQYNLKEIDKFLWIQGQLLFGNNKEFIDHFSRHSVSYFPTFV